ncbi:RNA polymerase sigma factor [Jeotgalibacillus proteolyticus]|uniref:RNA polymerase sigma factor n=1 Tax=Jeotgalibacillus proteolyticus TaxID=2082395 RepID=A0A2S5G8S3_9BACL|nr:RNA polymerase sigma factor [Jeotgalibacillus proteolyticus]PPA69402.1 RNA polymerase sigma factor [Jeotgalibacillus proteolyticus]
MVFEDVEHAMKKLYRYCLTLTGSPWAAEDLVQEAMLKVYRMKRSDPGKEFSFSYLCTVAKNHFIDEKRKYQESVPYNEELYGKEYGSIEYAGLIELLLVNLPLKQSMLITLKDVFGYSSKVLRVSNESVKTALHRSRKKLKLAQESGIEKPPPTHEIIPALLKAIQDSNAMLIFYYYRLLEAQNFNVKRSNSESVFHVIDPDGNILEIVS